MHSYATVALLGAMLTVGAQATAPPVITAAPSPSQIAKAKRQASASPSPLTAYSFAYSDVPYQVNPYPVGRGPQSGFNQCNASTTGPNSQCQTAVMNNISDFCLWGSPTSGGTIGDVEAAVVAYCTTDKYGSRVIPAGALTGLQVLHTSEYIQWTGHIDMTALGLTASDTGGELDPHGADLLGNPLGGLVFSTSMPGGDNSTELQVQEWNNFVGSGVFCWKSCFNPSQGPGYCQNRFDLLGCSYNMPAAYEDNVFLECDADLQDIVGTYTGTDGKTTTWSQPESLPATSTLPWTPRVPSSSNCRTYTSSNLFPATLLGYQSSSAASATSGASSGASSAASTSGAKSGSHASSSGPSATNSAANASASHTSGGDSIIAKSISLSVLVGLVGGIFALA